MSEFGRHTEKAHADSEKHREDQQRTDEYDNVLSPMLSFFSILTGRRSEKGPASPKAQVIESALLDAFRV